VRQPFIRLCCSVNAPWQRLVNTPEEHTPVNEKKLRDDLPFNLGADVDDASKSHTPDMLRNDKATWKEHDMPDDGDDPKAAPDDYERPDPDPTG
jgi:hypothetical protein